MLFIDLIDILYLLLGVVIGGGIVSYIDYMNCEDCKRSADYDK